MTANQCATLWANSPRFDETTRAEAARILRNEDELTRCFGHELSFGTGGLRGVLGVGSNRMNVYTVAKATEGLAAYLLSRGGKRVAISHDSRHGSREFALVTAGVLAGRGIQAMLFDRLMPTPVLSFATRALQADAGVMITASHNPAIYNGYKVYGADGCQITEEAADAITRAIEAVPYETLSWMTEAEARAATLLSDIPETVLESYLQKTLACRAHPGVSAPVTVCYTPLNGAGMEPVLKTLNAMPGVTTVVVADQAAPDGDFPTCPKPNPELKPTLELAIRTAQQSGAGLVIATDPDSDRIGVAVRATDGSFTVLTGNEVGLLLMESILSARQAAGTLPAHAEVVKTIVTSDLSFAIAKAYGVAVCETLTGFKYIGEEIGRLEKLGQTERYLFGFEESCGYLAGVHVRDKDGVMAAMLVCELAQFAAGEGKTLLDLLASLYARYGRMGTRLLNFDIAGADPMAEMRRSMETLRAQPPALLAGQPIAARKDYLNGVDGLPASDVLAYANACGKAIVRPSGTEPKVKVYLSAQGATEAQTEAMLDLMEADARCWLG
ncbi:MAG TPA: phospho-sugar mutase [Candidatus Limiplasma sp.]|nr:phospho-sugar mutase [Candidatus Limiplasma sp.]HPS81533.1 phospho-sugar mutase [Candidatus Limiplasma sp.]